NLGGYKVQGRGEAGAPLLDDARAVAEAGAFSVVMEMVPSGLAGQVTSELSIPTVAIGAGAETDAQVLVWQDMAGLTTGRPPRVPSGLAGQVTSELSSPTGAGGAGAETDAQALVGQDMAWLTTGRPPRFVKRAADLHSVLTEAVGTYVDEVKSGVFPEPERGFDGWRSEASRRCVGGGRGSRDEWASCRRWAPCTRDTRRS